LVGSSTVASTHAALHDRGVVVALVAQFAKLYYVYNAQMTQLEAQRREAVHSR